MIDPQLIGHLLLESDFRSWFLYVFNVIEKRDFVIEPIHEDLFKYFQSIYDGKTTRGIINLPPRSAKTTLAKYFVVYCITKNPKSNIIYTSYSQALLSTIAQEIIDILENPIYKALYPNYNKVSNIDTTPIDDFWVKYLKNENGVNQYSSKKIVTSQGGTTIFSAIGSQITGFGAGIRNCNTFSGFLLMDDPNKPADVKSKVLREKVLTYFEETLLSRLNAPHIPILLVQQRLHLQDLTGFLEEKYNFDILKKPLLDENGVCQIPSQYTEERIKELQVNNYMFQAQYLQSPIQDGGAVIKTDWFNYYPDGKYNYQKIVIAADTAMTVKESADYTALMVGGVTLQGKLHILDLVHGKFEYPELKQQLVNLYNKYQVLDEVSASAIYIENKASGIQLIQELITNTGLPIIPVDVTKDKLTRVEEILEYIASGNVLLPISPQYGFNQLILNECAEFNREQTQTHDDVVDVLVHLVNNTIAKKTVSILDVL